MARPKAELVLNEEERTQLESMARSRSLPAALTQRAKIVLACAAGADNSVVAKRFETSNATVGKWRSRFVERRMVGLHDELRPGKPRTIDDERVAELTGAVSGRLLLGASTTVAEFILPQILGEFKARYPQVQAHMSVANSETIENRVADHALDIGIIESPTHLPSVHTELGCEDELVLICAPGHRLARAKSVTPQEIVGEPFVSRESGSGTREFTDQYLRNCNVSPDDLNILMELGSPEAIKGVVETGVGVAIISRTRVVKERKLGLLTPVPLEPRLIRNFSLVFPKEKFRSRLLTTFSEFATGRMRKMAAET